MMQIYYQAPNLIPFEIATTLRFRRHGAHTQKMKEGTVGGGEEKKTVHENLVMIRAVRRCEILLFIG